MEVKPTEEQIGETLSRIHAAAMEEFSAKGFQSASLRNIVKTAGVTTGAFYGYYPSKEALFTALVGEVYDTLMCEYKESLTMFENMSSEQQIENMGTVGGNCMKQMMNYMDTHRAQVKLLLQSAEGTKYEHMIDEFVELEVDSTNKYSDMLRSMGQNVPQMDERLEHILVTGMFNAYFEMILHDMTLKDAMRYLEELNAFYTAGWQKIMGQ